MRRIYLIRHGEPNMNGGRMCLGCRTDVGLSDSGIAQSKALSELFEPDTVTALFSSKMTRSRETAVLLSDGRWSVRVLDGIQEMDVGEWDGLSFDVIREKYADIFEARGNDPTIPPPGGETYDSAAERGINALIQALTETSGDIAVVAHSGINRAIIGKLLNTDNITAVPQPYAAINVLGWDGTELSVLSCGKTVGSIPDTDEISLIYDKFSVSDKIKAHSEAVARKALEMNSRTHFDSDLINAACLLHDICRSDRNHTEKCAESLLNMGYLKLAGIVRRHHDCPSDGDFNEAKLLFLADKLVREDKYVSLEYRFAESFKKCTTDEAKAAHMKRYETALRIYRQYTSL